MMTLRPFTTNLVRSLAVMLLFCSAPVSAQQTERVAAVVNEDIVSMHDLEQRMRLALVSSNLPDSMEARSRIAPQVLRGLIDERLKMQEATRLKISITPAEVGNSVTNIERQNNMPAGGLESLLKTRGVEMESLRSQIRADLAWVRVVRHELLPDLHIGEAEIDQRLADLKANLGKPEFLVAEIFLPVESPANDAETRTLAERLIEQMRQGAPFPALARQFSQTGANGGDLGWVSQGMLDEVLVNALARLEPGNITPPIRTIDGYHIMLLRDKRIAGKSTGSGPVLDVLSVEMPVLPGQTDTERADQLAQLNKAVAGGKTCDDYERLIKNNMPTVDYNRNNSIKQSEIPPAIMQLIGNLPFLTFSEPLVEKSVRRVFAVCSRTEQSGDLPTRDDIRMRLEDEQMDTMARRYLRDLRRAAFVEIRV